jgi:hypothetical protein
MISASANNTDASRVTTWVVGLAALAYVVWTGTAFYRSMPLLFNLFASLGVELPLPTRLLIGTYPWLEFLVFGGAAILIVATQVAVRDRARNFAITAGATTFAVVVANVIQTILYHPLFDLINKLNR